MTEDLPARIREELVTRASSVDGTARLAERAMSEARGIRRRQMLAGVVPIAVTAVAVGGTTTLVSRLGAPDRSSANGPATSSTESTGVPGAGPTALSHASDPPRRPWVAGSVLTVNGRRVNLPADWAVLAILTAGETTVLDVSVMDDRFGALVTPSGGIDRSLDVEPPFALSADGRYLAGLSATRRVPDTEQQPVPQLMILDLEKRVVVHRTRVDEHLFPRWFLGSRTDEVLVSPLDGPQLIWKPDTGRLERLDLPLVGSRPLAVDKSGRLFITSDGEGSVSAQRLGATRPEWSARLAISGRAALSADGTRVALFSDDALVILATADGRVLSRSAPLGGQGPWYPTWEDSETVLMSDLNAVEGSGVFRCEAATGRCTELVIGSGSASKRLVLVAE